MELIMDMVHDNPGESRTVTQFRDPQTIHSYGYNAQVFKHFNTIVDFPGFLENSFPTEEAREWLFNMKELLLDDLEAAKQVGLLAISHIDLFVLPKAIVEKYKEDICDENGRISIRKSLTKKLHSIMFDQMFNEFGLDGIIVRVGETYLHDTPFHTGNGAVAYGDIPLEKDLFTELLQFLREEVCIKHNKYLIFRTWDCKPDRFHADLSYYLDVTNKILPHEKLIFSIKHTALDFWRRVRFNPCLCQGNHRQVVEVQCQREYEGKGAYPSYVMEGVINGFAENKEKIGLRDIVNDHHICGIYTWSRGGGWFGPYIQNEFWCDLNTFVISAYASDTSRTEEEIFLEFAKDHMGLDDDNARRFHKLCLKINEAVLHSRYIEAYDKSLKERIMPSLWMRDDRIAGLRQLDKVFDYLECNGLVDAAIAEKEYAVSLWSEICDEMNAIPFPDIKMAEFLRESALYGLKLFRIALICFRIFAKQRIEEDVSDLLTAYDQAWKDYKSLETMPQASSSFCEKYIFSPGDLGLNETIAHCRSRCIQ